MKLLLLTFSILFLASCQQYKYHVTYEKCNGQTGSFTSTQKPGLSFMTLSYNNGYIYPVCGMSYTSTPLQ